MFENEENDTDLLTLRYTLLQSRKQLSNLLKTLFETEYAYSKVELREDFNQLKTRTDQLKTETDLFKENFHDLMENCQILIHQTTEILSERDFYYSEWKYAKDILTPRPDWDKCADLVPNWRNLSVGKSSDELVEIIRKEIDPGEHSQMRRRITGLLIKEIWSTKAKMNMSDYVSDYLSKRFQHREINLRDACYRYQNHYEINIFWKILTEQMEEYVYHYQMKQYARILQAFIRLALKSITIKWSDVREVLRELYPKWTNERIERLIKSIERELQQLESETNEFEFYLLFMEDDEGRVGEFLRTIREELDKDKQEYIEQIKNILLGQPLISIKQFKQAVKLVDPLIPKNELHRYINWIYKSNSKERQNPMRDLEEILNRLENCACFMH